MDTFDLIPIYFRIDKLGEGNYLSFSFVNLNNQLNYCDMNKFLLMVFVFLFFSCINKPIKNEKISIESKFEHSDNLNSTHAVLSNDSVLSILTTIKDISKQKTFREAIPFLENVLNINFIDNNNKLIFELLLSEYYLLYYLIDNSSDYYNKSYTLFCDIIVRDSSLTYLSVCLDIKSETLKEFKSKWQSTSNQNSREELMIKAFIEKFKTTN